MSSKSLHVLQRACAFVLCACLLSLTVFAAPVEETVVDSFSPTSDSLASISPLADSSSAWTSNDVKNLLNYVVNIRTYTSETSTNTKNNGTTLTTLSNTATAISKALGTSQYPTIQQELESIFNQMGMSGRGNDTLRYWLGYVGDAIVAAIKDSSSTAGSSFSELLTEAQGIHTDTTSISASTTAIKDGFGYDSQNTLASANTVISENISDIRSLFWDSDSFRILESSEDSPVDTSFRDLMSLLLGSVRHTTNNEKGVSYLNNNGLSVYTTATNGATVAWSVSQGFDGLASILRGGSGATLKNTIYDSQTANADGTLASADWEANNILSAFSVLFPIQHDVARLTNVLATGPKIALEKSQEENVQAVTENFTGDKGVQTGDIGEMSGIGDNLGSVADTGVSIGDGFSQLGNSWNFFSNEIAATLDTAPAITAEEEEDFIHFFDANNAEFDALLGRLRGE